MCQQLISLPSMPWPPNILSFDPSARDSFHVDTASPFLSLAACASVPFPKGGQGTERREEEAGARLAKLISLEKFQEIHSPAINVKSSESTNFRESKKGES